MFSFEDLIRHPFPLFIYNCLLRQAADATNDMSKEQRARVLALQAVCEGRLDEFHINLKDAGKATHALALATEILRSAYRVAPADHVAEMAKAICDRISTTHPNKVQVGRVSSSLTKGVQEVFREQAASPSLVPKQVLLDDAPIRDGEHPRYPALKLLEPTSSPPAYGSITIHTDPNVDRGHVETTLNHWIHQSEKDNQSLSVLVPGPCITTAMRATPMLEQGPILVALAPCIEVYHHAAWVGATLAHPDVTAELDAAIVVPRIGIGYYYHQIIDHIALIMALQNTPLAGLPILAAEDLSKFRDYLAVLGVDISSVHTYTDASPYRVRNAHIVPIAHYSRPKVQYARRALGEKEGDPRKKIYISRSKSPLRPLTNEKEIEDIVSSAGYRVVHLEKFTFREQVEIMSEASAIIAPHGGGLANLLFCGRNAKVLELLSEAYLVGFFYRLARACDFAYSAYVGAADRAANGVHAWKMNRDKFVAALREFDS